MATTSPWPRGLFRHLIALLALGMFVACDGESEGEVDSGTDAELPDGGECDVTEIFARTCAGSVCHSGGSPAADLDLLSPGLDERISLAPANQCPGTLADPSDPISSVMYEKVAGVPSCGSRMPLAPAPVLTDPEIACVRDWISGLQPPPPPPPEDMGVVVDAGPPEDMFQPPPDMGPVCEEGETEACYSGPRRTIGIGVCVEGLRTCTEDRTGFGPCEGEIVPGVEDCRTADIDENCDGVTPACSDVWSFAFGDDKAQSARSVAIDSQGNVFMAGDFESTIGVGGDPLVAEGVKSDIVFAKYDPFGNPLWSRSYGDTSNQFATQVVVGGDDSVFMIGRAFGVIGFGGQLHDGVGTDDIFVVKFDNDGVFQWSRMFGGLDPDRAERLAIDGEGDVLITGTFTGVVDFGSGPFESAGLRDAFVLKLDGRTGAHVFSKQIGGEGDDYGFGIAAAADGDILISGRFEETIEIDQVELESAGGRDIYLARLDNFGTARWSRRYGGPEEDLAYDLAYDPASGGFVLHGALTGNVTFGGIEVRGAGERDIFLAAFGADDGLRWVAAYGDETDQYETDFDTNTWSSIALDGEGNIHLVGPLSGEARFGDGPPLRSAGRTDAYVVKLDPDGRFLFGNRYGTDNTEIGLDVAVAPDGHIAIAGRIFGTRGVDFGAAGRVESFGSSDGFILHVSP